MKELRTGRMIVHVRANVDDPNTEATRSVERYAILNDEEFGAWKAAGHCGKPASAYSLYCDNHQHMHLNDDPAQGVIQAIDNRPQGRQRVVMCAHITTPKTQTVPPTPAAMQTVTATTRTEKGKIMSNNTVSTVTPTVTPTVTNVNLDAIAAQIAALNAALAALAQAPAAPAASAPAVTAPASTPASAPAVTAPASTPASAPAASTAILTLSGPLQGSGLAVFKTFRPDVVGYANHGYFASFKAVNPATGERFQVTCNIAAIKPEDVRKAVKAKKNAQ